MGCRHSFHVTGESCRASGYGEPAGQNLPTPGPLACELPPGAVAPGFEHASRIAAPGSVNEAAAADRLSMSRLVIPPCPVGRSLGCLAMDAHVLSPSLER